MSESQRFPYVEIDQSLGAASALPYARITLELDGNVASVSALVDSGAALSVLPSDLLSFVQRRCPTYRLTFSKTVGAKRP